MTSIHQLSTSSVIGLDMDEVLAELHRPWIEWLNFRFGTRIPADGFSDWDEPTRRVGRDAYDFLTPSIYSSDIVKPIPWALAAVGKIKSLGYTIIVVSSCLNDTFEAKRDWCVRHGFLAEDEAHRFLPMHDKRNAPCDVLVDDAMKNVESFAGLGILVTRRHNRHEHWRGFRIDHLSDLAGLLTAVSIHSPRRAS